MRSRYAAVLLFVIAGSGCTRAQAPLRPAPRAPVLLELFTSEGCSSCPPADALLRSLSGTTTRDGQLLIALSEHVTYWNRLGWKDPFSSDLFTERQNGYGDRFHLDSVYTPQMVINGSAQVVGSNRDAVLRAIASQTARASALEVRTLSSRIANGKLNLKLSVSWPVPDGGVDLFVAIADDMQTSQVKRGENEGRTLSHVAVARNLIRVGRLEKPTEGQEFSVPVPPDHAPGMQHLVLFAQRPNFGAVLGVDSQPLPRSAPE